MKQVGLALCLFLTLSVVFFGGDVVFGGEARLVTPGSTWLFLDDGSNAGTAWRQPDFDDSGWAEGGAQIGYGDQDEVSIARCRVGMSLGQICASGGPADKIVTTYFRRSFQYRGAADVSGLRLYLLADDGAVIYLNGTEIARVNIPGGEIQFDTLATTAVGNEQEYVNINAAAGALQEGENLLAVEIHQHSRSSSDISFDLGLYGEIDNQPGLPRGPYLQSGTPESAIILWRTDAVTNSRIEISATPDGASPLVFTDPVGGTEHGMVVDFSSLQTDKVYYAIGDSDAILADFDPEQYIRVPEPPGVDDTTRVWVIGDSGSADQLAMAVRDGFRKFNGDQPIDAWLMLGDNAYDDGTDEEYQAAVFDMYPMLLRQTMLWPTLGNHDIRNADSPTQTGVYFNLFALPVQGEIGGMASGTEAYYSFDLNNIHFVVLDSADTQLADDGAMAEWLKADLASTLQPWIIAFWHHPPYSKGSHDSDSIRDSGGRMTRMRENLLPILEDGGVDLTLSGHSHSYERSFLLHGHHDTSDTLTPAMILDAGGGRPAETGAYFKTPLGAVHAVAGSSGRLSSSGDLDHPAMFVSLRSLGSMVLEIDGERLDGTFLNEDGDVLDTFTLVKASQPQISVAPSLEGREGGTVEVVVSLDQEPIVDVVVDYATVASTAEAGEDFGSVSGTISFTPGVQSFSLVLDLLADDLDEGDEIFIFELSNPRNADLASAQAEITVLDNDGAIEGCVDCEQVTCLMGQTNRTPQPSGAIVLPDLLVPAFAVDTNDPNGETTLYAVRNLSDAPTSVDIVYLDKFFEIQTEQTLNLGANATGSVNLRDIPGLVSDANGFSRGSVAFNSRTAIGGDFFRVDVTNNFASGGRLVDELCFESELRFLDFGSGTEVDLVLAAPLGGDPATDDPSFSVDVTNEAGQVVDSLRCYTDQHLLELDAALFTGASFGSLIFDFTASGGGHASARYSSDGRFSVGVDQACRESAAEDLLLPAYEVDTTDPSGTTTLFAVRNTSNDTVEVRTDYNLTDGTELRRDTTMLAPNATLSVNIRDISGLTTDGNGFARGYVEISASGSDQPNDAVLVGDFFQVDVGSNFATGERLISPTDFCQRGEIRFLDFGEGTRLRVYLEDSQGDNPSVDPPSFTVVARDESGAELATQLRFTDEDSLTFQASDFTDATFGTLQFDFTNSAGGYAYAEYSAEGRFSVGVEMTCTE